MLLPPGPRLAIGPGKLPLPLSPWELHVCVDSITDSVQPIHQCIEGLVKPILVSFAEPMALYARRGKERIIGVRLATLDVLLEKV